MKSSPPQQDAKAEAGTAGSSVLRQAFYHLAAIIGSSYSYTKVWVHMLSINWQRQVLLIVKQGVIDFTEMKTLAKEPNY